MQVKTFEDYLQEQCDKEGGYEGVYKDGYESAFERWLEGKDVNDIIEYGTYALKEAYNKQTNG